VDEIQQSPYYSSPPAATAPRAGDEPGDAPYYTYDKDDIKKKLDDNHQHCPADGAQRFQN